MKRTRRQGAKGQRAASADALTDPRFAALVAELAADPARAGAVEHLRDPPSSRRKFGANALKAEGKIFAMLAQGQLVLKLPRQRVADLVASGAGAHFDPGHGRVVKEWVCLVDRDLAWAPLAREAHDYVAGLLGS